MNAPVVIVNWNSGERLKSCFESLPSGAEIVVVDNASEDDSIRQAKEARPSALFILNSSNRGFAAGLNQGFAATSSNYVLVLNPDIRVTTGAIEMLESTLDTHERAGVAGGYVNDKYLPCPVATPWSIIRENLGMPVPHQKTGTESEAVGQAAAAALMVRREAYEATGGFDERFVPAWYEDVDFCKCLHDTGWEVRFVRGARFHHEGGYSARALGNSAFAAAYYRNQLRYVQKHYRAAAPAVRASLIAGMSARLLASPSKASACWQVMSGALGGW